MTNIDELAAEWLAVKNEELALTAQRHAIEEKLAAFLETKNEGSITHKLEEFKVTLTQPVTRKLDLVHWEKVKSKIDESLYPLRRWCLLILLGVVIWQRKEPKLWAKIAPAFETKSGKIGVKVELL
jgi:hypothetical protein